VYEAEVIKNFLFNWLSRTNYKRLPEKEEIQKLIPFENDFEIYGDTLGKIIIEVKDVSGKCPMELQEMNPDDGITGGWEDGVYILHL